jgi:hypothetical protein
MKRKQVSPPPSKHFVLYECRRAAIARGSTFNRIVKAILGSQLDRNVSTYVDDVVVRSLKRHITFRTVGKHSPTFGDTVLN